ncbi:uncharacterized protein F5891DRAFT_901186, partial [Suillus fuscotomentosus]
LLLTVSSQRYVLHVHDTSAKQKTSQLTFELMEKKYNYVKDVLFLTIIGVCGDAGGDEKQDCLLFLHKYPWMLVMDCRSHQVHII